MRSFLIISFLFLSTFAHVQAQAQAQEPKQKPDPTKKTFVVDASCGSCNFEMKGKGCFLAVKLDGKKYFVDGTGLDDHGDAHETDGFCLAVRKAKIQGEITGDRILVSYFELLK